MPVHFDPRNRTKCSKTGTTPRFVRTKRENPVPNGRFLFMDLLRLCRSGRFGTRNLDFRMPCSMIWTRK